MLNILKKTFVFLLSALIVLGFTENYLYSKGLRFDNNREKILSTYPKELQPLRSTVLNVASPRQMPSYEDPQATETIWENGQRKSRPNINKKGEKKVLLLGCSYTYGMGVDDTKTFAWLLNSYYPNIVFDNYGYFGYSTYQCFMLEEQILKTTHYDLVIYCCMDKHFLRNVEVNNPGVNAMLPWEIPPYVKIDSQGKVHLRPATFHHWPLEEHLAIINFIKGVYIGIVRQGHIDNSFTLEYQNKAFAFLVNNMATTAKKHKAKFILATLDPDSFKQIKDIQLDCPIVDVSIPQINQPQCRINKVLRNHPNWLVHQVWAEKFIKWFDRNKIITSN